MMAGQVVRDKGERLYIMRLEVQDVAQAEGVDDKHWHERGQGAAKVLSEYPGS